MHFAVVKLMYFPMQPDLCRIVQSGGYSLATLKLCHDLLVRYLRHSPQGLEEVLPHYVSCLKSHDWMVVTTTIPYIPNIIALSTGKYFQVLLCSL